jgi:hypothetical protein
LRGRDAGSREVEEIDAEPIDAAPDLPEDTAAWVLGELQ